MSTAKDTLARISALEARITALETTNARLVDVASRLFDLVANRTEWVSEWVSEELAERDGEAAATTVELASAISSRAPRGFRFPITVHETIVENRPSDFWVFHNYRMEKAIMRSVNLELLLERKGVISSSEQFGLAILAGSDPREPTPCEENS
jgi:hypothetical protein